MMQETARSLRSAWNDLRAQGVRIRAASDQLGCSEAELLERTDGYDVVQLEPQFARIFEAFHDVGDVMASTRNEWAVIEKTGTYDNIDVGERMGIVLAEEIDLRLFMWNFERAYAVTKPDHNGKPLHSVQFFDASGLALHKVYFKGAARHAFDDFVQRFRADDGSAFVPKPPSESSPNPLPDAETLDAFREAWRDLQDTHDFFGMLREYSITRRQAFHHGPEELVQRLADRSVTPWLLAEAAERQVPIMCFVGNRGCIEIHTGPVHKIIERGSWINVMDPRFNLHLNLDGVGEAWLVRKPTVDGIVTSIELLAEDGSVIAQFFGERKPGKAELESWRELAEAAPR